MAGAMAVAERVAARLGAIPGVVAVALGGSWARGEAQAGSDVDLGLYYRPDHRPALAALNRLAEALDDRRPTAAVTDFGAWGPWIDGGAWLVIEGQRVDWLFRDLDRVASAVADCRAGRLACAYQPGHPHGFHAHIYAGEVHHARPLHDPEGALAALQQLTATYSARAARGARPAVSLGGPLRPRDDGQGRRAWRRAPRGGEPLSRRRVRGAGALRAERALVREREGRGACRGGHAAAADGLRTHGGAAAGPSGSDAGRAQDDARPRPRAPRRRRTARRGGRAPLRRRARRAVAASAALDPSCGAPPALACGMAQARSPARAEPASPTIRLGISMCLLGQRGAPRRRATSAIPSWSRRSGAGSSGCRSAPRSSSVSASRASRSVSRAPPARPRLVAPRSGTDHTGGDGALRPRAASRSSRGSISRATSSRRTRRAAAWSASASGAGAACRRGRASARSRASSWRRCRSCPVEEEGRLHDPRLRENFVERVFAYARWQALLAARPTPRRPRRLPHRAQAPPPGARAGGLPAPRTSRRPRQGATARPRCSPTTAAGFMDALRVLATPRRHANVLEHMLGYFSSRAGALAPDAERREIVRAGRP